MKKIIATALALVLCLSIMSMVAFAEVPALDSLAIVGENIPGVPSWAPEAPEGDMTKVSDGVYEKILECPAGTNMNFKVAGNDKWDDTCNFGSATLVLGQKADLECSGGSGNMNLTFDKATKIKITVDVNPMKENGAATILVEEVNVPPAPTTQPTTTTKPATTTTQPTTTAKPDTTGKRNLIIKAPASWTTVNIYTWEPASLGDFPGAVVNKSGSDYKASIDKAIVNLVVSGVKADTTRQQTGDIKLETNGKDVTITIKDDGTFTVAYDGVVSKPQVGKEAKDDAGTPSNYRVAGNADWMGNWNEANELGRMNEVEPGLFRKTFHNVKPGSYELKITKDGKWDGAYGDNGQNYCFTVNAECSISVEFTIKNGVGIIDVYGTGVNAPPTGDISMLSVVVLMALASVTAIVLVSNKKKFI